MKKTAWLNWLMDLFFQTCFLVYFAVYLKFSLPILVGLVVFVEALPLLWIATNKKEQRLDRTLVGGLWAILEIILLSTSVFYILSSITTSFLSFIGNFLVVCGLGIMFLIVRTKGMIRLLSLY